MHLVSARARTGARFTWTKPRWCCCAIFPPTGPGSIVCRSTAAPSTFAAASSASRKGLYDFWANAGGLFFALQRDQESEAALQHAATLYPGDPNVRMTLARLYHRHGMLAQAEAEYRAILVLDETDQSWDELGHIYVEERRLPEAEQAFRVLPIWLQLRAPPT